MSHTNSNEIQYENRKTQSLSDDTLVECAELFSANYGNYSDDSDFHPGQSVRLGASYYKNNYCTPDFSVALARHAGKIIGQAFYIRKNYENTGIMTWVVQLVVDKAYRQMGIASTLLRSIWGFSDDYAWGLATANPCTVKTLEVATLRECKSKIIFGHVDDIRKISQDIGFAKDVDFEVSDNSSQINSHFSVDNHDYRGIEECEKKLGKLKPGREWLAFVFQDQNVNVERYKKSFADLISFSEAQLKDAYSRMDMGNHPWARGTSSEVSFIYDKVRGILPQTMIDLGCGTGRHSIEFAKLGLKVCGVDFSKTHIQSAEAAVLENHVDSCTFECSDVRDMTDMEKYDLALCLYDVIGSFPSEEDNAKVIESAYRVLKPGGYFVASVMNMELTESLVPESQKGVLSENPEILLHLKPGNVMQSTGNIFDPQYLAIDTSDGLVYRKEQFGEDDMLPAEYVIRDKRYRMSEIVALIERAGFTVEDSRFVRAGAFEEALSATDPHAKEILVIARK